MALSFVLSLFAPVQSSRRQKKCSLRANTIVCQTLPQEFPGDLPNPESIVLRSHYHDHEVLLASQGPHSISEMADFIRDLRRQRLSLLIADLIARVRYQFPSNASRNPLRDHLAVLNQRGSELLIDIRNESRLRAQMRSDLWQLREMLDPLHPCEWLRTSLEVARSGFLDIPGREADDGDESKLRGEMYALMAENILLEELRSLRILEQRLSGLITRFYPGVAVQQMRETSDASGLLGIDDYRVRGKTRLADAVVKVRSALTECSSSLNSEVDEALHVLHNSLIESLKTDLDARRPAGEAMLLRPRMDDIPNFTIVNEGMLRGGQPTSRGLAWLANYGVRLVVDLRGSDRQNQWEMPKCQLLSLNSEGINEDTGLMNVCNIPIEDFQTPSIDQVYQFIDLLGIVMGSGGVVFIHCKAGIGRTGTMIACWRIYHGEDVNTALAKESLYSEGGGGLRQEEFVRYFAMRHSNQKRTSH